MLYIPSRGLVNEIVVPKYETYALRKHKPDNQKLLNSTIMEPDYKRIISKI